MALGPDISHQMSRARGVAVDVAIKAGHALHALRVRRLAIGRGVELLLRELRHQQAYAFQVFGVENAAEDLLEILHGQYLTLRDVAQVGPGGEKDGRRELGQEMVGQIEVHVKSLQARQDFDLGLRKNHAAHLVLGMRQRQESLRKETLGPESRPGPSSQVDPRSRSGGSLVAGPTGIGFPRVILTVRSVRADRSYRSSRRAFCRAMTWLFSGLSLAILVSNVS